MIDTKELGRLAQAVSGWGNCNQAWLDQSEDTPAAVVGHINEDGETYPVVTIDCDQYYAADQSLPLGKFYAAANPTAVIELLDRLEAAEKGHDELHSAVCREGDRADAYQVEVYVLRAKIEAAEKERDTLRAELLDAKETVRELFHGAGVANMTITTLQARVEALERQEPSREWWDNLIADISAIDCVYRGCPSYAHDAYWLREHVVQMFEHRRDAIPSAQPAPSVPELLESLRCACNYIDKLGGVSQQYRAMLASSEAKP